MKKWFVVLLVYLNPPLQKALSAGLASAYLNKLSDTLRFMLHEAKTEEICLEKALLYIGKYIQL